MDASNGSFQNDSVPFGLGALLNNVHKKDEKLWLLVNGVIDDTYIMQEYKDMMSRVKGARSPLMVNFETKEYGTFPVRSRWNREWNYSEYVRNKLSKEVAGLRKVSHMTLTVQPSKLSEIIPGWWAYGDRLFLAVFGGYMVRDFLKRLQLRKRRRGDPWNFIGWSMEFTKQGYAHWHMIFYGGYIATFAEIHKLWGLCEPQGIDIKKGGSGGYKVASYLCKYVSKSLGVMPHCDEKRIPAFVWFFKRRLYNIRHNVKEVNEDVLDVVQA